MSQTNDAYSQAVSSGKYDRGKSYYKKYDNVRIFWEDALTRKYMKPAIAARLEACRQTGRKLRILDLGCGSGDGLEMFLDIPAQGDDLRCDTNRLITDDSIGHYTGIDLNEDLLQLNEERWGNDPKMSFLRGDLSQGLPPLENKKPFDIYFAGYGTLSHLNREETIRLLCDIVHHAESGSIIIGDWLGRFSYEWQDLWDDNTSQEQWMDYYISYIHPPEIRKSIELSPLQLRLVTREEITKHVVEKVCSQTGGALEVEGFYDRSIFIGRHMDTGDYNRHTPHLRRVVNSLFERCQRTSLKNLLIEYHPHESLEGENAYFDQIFNSWNYVISRCASLLYGENIKPDIEQNDLPEIAKTTVNRFQTMIDHLDCFYADDIRGDVLEMQLGFLLRDFEVAVQKGHGNGHGLIGIFEVKK